VLALERAWPSNRRPSREQVERLYRLAYLLDPDIFKPSDAVNFGVDFRKLKEFGEVSMSKDVGVLRRHLPALWDRLSMEQRAAFHMSYMLDGLEYAASTLGSLEANIGDTKEVHEALTWALFTLYGLFPRTVMQRLQLALRKWKGPSHVRS
jgi:hypothetical protein